jgi:DNA-binding IclR family transcriptional regulator
MHEKNPRELDRNDRTLKSVNITCEILHVVSVLDRPTLAEITAELEYSKSTVHDHLRTLVENDMLIRYSEHNPTCIANPPDQPCFETGFMFLRMGQRLRHRHGPMAVIEEQLPGLAADTDALAHFAVPEYGTVVYVAQERPPGAIDLGVEIGSRHPIHSTAYGRAALSLYDEADVRSHSWPDGVTSETPLAGGETILESIETARERGYAVDHGQTIEGATGVAAPVVLDGRIAGAIGVYAPEPQFTATAIADEVGPAVRSAARTVEVNAASQ